MFQIPVMTHVSGSISFTALIGYPALKETMFKKTPKYKGYETVKQCANNLQIKRVWFRNKNHV